MKGQFNIDDWVILSKNKGYGNSQRKQAMQVMELGADVMTVRCSETGCLTLPYDHFEKVEVVHASYFEDNRSFNVK